MQLCHFVLAAALLIASMPAVSDSRACAAAVRSTGDKALAGEYRKYRDSCSAYRGCVDKVVKADNVPAACRSMCGSTSGAQQKSCLKTCLSQTPSKTPGKTPNSTPSYTPNSTLSYAPGSSPANTRGNSPANIPGNSPANTPANIPANTPGNSPANTRGNSPANTPGNTPANTNETSRRVAESCGSLAAKGTCSTAQAAFQAVLRSKGELGKTVNTACAAMFESI